MEDKSIQRLSETEVRIQNLIDGLNATASLNGTPHTILIVEDSNATCMVVTNRLKKEGFDVKCVHDPCEAMAVIEDPNQPLYMVFFELRAHNSEIFQILEMMQNRIVPRCVLVDNAAPFLTERLRRLDVDYMQLRSSGEVIELQTA